MAVIVIAAYYVPKSSDVPDIPNNEIRHFKTYYASPKDKPDMSIPSQRDLHMESPQSYTEHIQWIDSGSTRKIKIVREELLYSNNKLRSEFLIAVGNELTMIKVHRKWTAQNGDVLRDREHEFIDPSFGYPKKTYHLISVPWLLRLSDLKPDLVFEWYVWIDSYFVYPIILKVEGEEKIKTEAGEFDCWRCIIQLDRKRIDDIMGIIVARSQSKFLMWYDKNSTNGLVRLVYPISTGMPGQRARFQTQDLVKVDKVEH